MKRYNIEAKRRNTDEEWSSWAVAKNYYKALEHEAHVEEVGYEGRTVIHPEVKEIWAILGGDSGGVKVTTDKIFDAGYRKASTVRAETERRVTRKVAKHILTEIAEAYEKYGGAYGLKECILKLEQEYGFKDCRDCHYFVGCEAACGGRICGEFKDKEK